jgi:hypothetical protein
LYEEFLPPVDEWPQRPILLTQEQEEEGCCTGKKHKVVLANEETVPIHSEIFSGHAQCFVRNSASEGKENQYQSAHDKQQLGSHAKYFRNRKRQAGVILKGRFKTRVCFADLIVGNEFGYHFVETGKAQRAVVALVVSLLRKLVPHLTLSLGDTPKLFAPVVLDCKSLSVNTIENDKNNDGVHFNSSIEEDTALLGGWFASQKRSARQRKTFFSKASNRRQFYFETGYEYSFEFYQHTLSFETYVLSAGPIQIDIGRITKGQPLQFCLRAKSKRVCKFNFWSERLLAHWPEPEPGCGDGERDKEKDETRQDERSINELKREIG